MSNEAFDWNFSGARRVEARSEDGIIEGLRLDGARWMLGVQFHPELMAATDPDAAAIFRKFGEMCL